MAGIAQIGSLNEEMPISKTQIDRLGDRLKVGHPTESDLRLLDEYRWSFGEAYETVIRTIRQRGASPTGRLAKSTGSIIAKLRRGTTHLSQMQDIAGCRVVVRHVLEQEDFLASLKTDFPEASVIDRRDKPSHGYRAVHIIAKASGKWVEIQIRTGLQHLWAELSERASDLFDPTIKYGGGPDWLRNSLTKRSEAVASIEEIQKAGAVSFGQTLGQAFSRRRISDLLNREISRLEEELKRRKQ